MWWAWCDISSALSQWGSKSPSSLTRRALPRVSGRSPEMGFRSEWLLLFRVSLFCWQSHPPHPAPPKFLFHTSATGLETLHKLAAWSSPIRKHSLWPLRGTRFSFPGKMSLPEAFFVLWNDSARRGLRPCLGRLRMVDDAYGLWAIPLPWLGRKRVYYPA